MPAPALAQRAGGFVSCCYAEQHATRREAMSREWHLKRDRTLRKRLAQGG